MKGLTDVFGVMMVEIVVVPVMMTTTHASQPDQQACAIAWRPRCKFPWPPNLRGFGFFGLAKTFLGSRYHAGKPSQP